MSDLDAKGGKKICLMAFSHFLIHRSNSCSKETQVQTIFVEVRVTFSSQALLTFLEMLTPSIITP